MDKRSFRGGDKSSFASDRVPGSRCRKPTGGCRRRTGDSRLQLENSPLPERDRSDRVALVASS
ncbi:hypothetical protein EYF80_024709 [Liparis tanakae]|uniref:Uncharacterized protein n=1 Tax=Liparis tanakae TaxID=230148 RepID=A0A4Z2HHT6_9TELE|nr:hypothetical protein EYF80_024709 [Liparis tanakae]